MRVLLACVFLFLAGCVTSTVEETSSGPPDGVYRCELSPAETLSLLAVHGEKVIAPVEYLDSARGRIVFGYRNIAGARVCIVVFDAIQDGPGSILNGWAKPKAGLAGFTCDRIWSSVAAELDRRGISNSVVRTADDRD